MRAHTLMACIRGCGQIFDGRWRSAALGLALAPAAVAQPVLVVNPSFETGDLLGRTFRRVFAGGDAITGWRVESGSVDHIGSYWAPHADGSRSVDLNGPAGQTGAIAQDLATEPGRIYELRFDLSADHHIQGVVRTLRVSAAGQFTDFVPSVPPTPTMGWTECRWRFAANSTSTTLRFESRSAPTYSGPAIDNVRVMQLDAFENGSFESGDDPGRWRRIRAYSSELPGWSVTHGAVDYIGTYWSPHGDGARSIDLNGGAGEAGRIAQRFLTIPNRRYELSFDLSTDHRVQGAPRRVRVSVAGVQREYDVDPPPGPMVWHRKSIPFFAIGDVTEVAFESLSPETFAGPAIDDVRVGLSPIPYFGEPFRWISRQTLPASAFGLQRVVHLEVSDRVGPAGYRAVLSGVRPGSGNLDLLSGSIDPRQGAFIADQDLAALNTAGDESAPTLSEDLLTVVYDAADGPRFARRGSVQAGFSQPLPLNLPTTGPIRPRFVGGSGDLLQFRMGGRPFVARCDFGLPLPILDFVELTPVDGDWRPDDLLGSRPVIIDDFRERIGSCPRRCAHICEVQRGPDGGLRLECRFVCIPSCLRGIEIEFPRFGPVLSLPVRDLSAVRGTWFGVSAVSGDVDILQMVRLGDRVTTAGSDWQLDLDTPVPALGGAPVVAAVVLGQLGTGSLQLPGIGGALGLTPPSLVSLGSGPAVAGRTSLTIPVPASLAGSTFDMQMATFDPASGDFELSDTARVRIE